MEIEPTCTMFRSTTFQFPSSHFSLPKPYTQNCRPIGMRRWCIPVVLAVSLLGCRSFKDQQRPDLVADTQTKIYYKNVPDNEDKIPPARRKYFKSMDEAMGEGYSSVQAAGSVGGDDKGD
jgi:hypothetical protein